MRKEILCALLALIHFCALVLALACVVLCVWVIEYQQTLIVVALVSMLVVRTVSLDSRFRQKAIDDDSTRLSDDSSKPSVSVVSDFKI